MDIVYRVPETEIVRATRAYARGDVETLVALKRPTPTTFDAGIVGKLVAHTIAGPWKEAPPMSDGWLAPRLHASVRMPRRIAADRGVWFWLATGVFRPYLEWRHSRTSEDATWWRYNGELLRNGVARLWWGAEMLRNGPDYSLVSIGFRSVRTFMFVSELRYSRYREAARAFARVAAGVAGDAALNDAEVGELSVLFNTYLRLDVLESHGEGATAGGREWDPDWGERVPTWMELVSEDPKALVSLGPDGGYADAKKEDALVDWLRRLVPEARARARAKKSGDAMAAEPAGAA